MSVKNGKYLKCKICKKVFYAPKSRLPQAKFCGYGCDYVFRESLTGSKNGFFGKKHSEKAKEKMSRDNHYRWKGGRVKHPSGYVYILAKYHPRTNAKGYVYEHILVMEQVLGRYKWPQEVVHHINGVKDDNRPENLMLFPSNSVHVRYHQLIKARLAPYGFQRLI